MSLEAFVLIHGEKWGKKFYGSPVWTLAEGPFCCFFVLLGFVNLPTAKAGGFWNTLYLPLRRGI